MARAFRIPYGGDAHASCVQTVTLSGMMSFVPSSCVVNVLLITWRSVTRLDVLHTLAFFSFVAPQNQRKFYH